ncbi:hypothetical protein EVAR_43996_1 [Eumeta japonica]|uniref:Uncharacterized protein n=1 Tax=Eumeta variegata TaxID=151549 RepID=A0A4C1XH39_EUMVA|nr:hypothetical protein EVAR_43996_1 [Eumeta japonica]
MSRAGARRGRAARRAGAGMFLGPEFFIRPALLSKVNFGLRRAAVGGGRDTGGGDRAKVGVYFKFSTRTFVIDYSPQFFVVYSVRSAVVLDERVEVAHRQNRTYFSCLSSFSISVLS